MGEIRPVSEHPTFPPLEFWNGEKVIHAMEAWTIVWAGDEALGAQIDKFLSVLLTSSYWQGLADYGVGSGMNKGVIVLPGSPPTDTCQISDVIQGILGNQVSSPNSNTALVFLFPSGTLLKDPNSPEGCAPLPGALGYHDLSAVAFVAVAEQNTLDETTSVLSHEAVEAATNGWYLPLGKEIADLCEDLADHDIAITQPGDGGTAYAAQRWFSRAAAAAGNLDPCVPAPAEPYFGVAVDPSPVQDSCGYDSLIRLMPFTYGSQTSIHWETIRTSPIEPRSGDAAPGETVYVRGSFTGLGLEIVATDPAKSSHQTCWYQPPQ